MKKPIGIILAGGQSKRLFPVSTPKPLLKVDGRPLLMQAIDRLKGFEVKVVANQEIANEIRRAFRKDGFKVPSFIIEPEGRDTAAAVGFALSKIGGRQKKNWVAVLSADQWMPDAMGSNGRRWKNFVKTVAREIKSHPTALFVAGSRSQTKPKNSHGQFGWILGAKKLGRSPGVKSFGVKSFIEKPKRARLDQLRKKGGMINAGMFFGCVETFLAAYEKSYPAVLKPKVNYSKLKRLPIDKAIFENYLNVRALALPVRWEDLGTWEDWFKHVGSLQKLGPKSKNSFLYSDSGFTLYSFGMTDLALIQSGDKVLAMPLSATRDLKTYLELLP